MRRRTWTAIITVILVAGACGSGEDRPGQVTSEGGGPGSKNPSGSVSGTGSVSASGTGGGSATPADGDGYKPVSDVTAQAAIGKDIARVKELLATPTEGQAVDWVAVRTTITTGGASKKSDGSARTLATLVGDDEAVSFLLDAVDATGASGGADDRVRAQRVDKAISVLLAAKVGDELAGAGEKVAQKDLDPAKGAPHSVDEAWAFFTAGGNGLAATADKRATDFKREGKVREPVVAALAAAQRAAAAGDATALERAADDVGEGLAYIFYLATYKYLDTGGDEAKRAEGETFYRGIQPAVRSAAPEADAAIVASFARGDAAGGRTALHQPSVMEALGVEQEERVGPS